jgi:hypothetical protein
MNLLSKNAELDFNKHKKWWFFLLSKSHQLIFIWRWFNVHTKVKIDILSDYNDQDNSTYYQWFVPHPFFSINKVYTDQRDVNKNPHRDFDECLSEAIEMAGKIYNATKV